MCSNLFDQLRSTLFYFHDIVYGHFKNFEHLFFPGNMLRAAIMLANGTEMCAQVVVNVEKCFESTPSQCVYFERIQRYKQCSGGQKVCTLFIVHIHNKILITYLFSVSQRFKKKAKSDSRIQHVKRTQKLYFIHCEVIFVRYKIIKIKK